MTTMGTWHFYDVGTGMFSAKSYTGPESSLQDNTPAGMAPMLGVTDSLAQRVDITVMPHVLIDYQPPAPADDAMKTWAWSATSKRWLASPTLASLKADRWATIKAARAAAIDAPLVTPQGTFDADAASRANILGAVVLAQTLTAQSQPVAIDFTLADNTVTTLTAATMVTVGLLLGSKTQAAYTRGQTLRALIEAATTSAALLAITW